jgi:hypothetical protein
LGAVYFPRHPAKAGTRAITPSAHMTVIPAKSGSRFDGAIAATLARPRAAPDGSRPSLNNEEGIGRSKN